MTVAQECVLMAVHARPGGEPTNAGAWQRLLSGCLPAVLGLTSHIHAPDRWAAPVPERNLFIDIRADRS